VTAARQANYNFMSFHLAANAQPECAASPGDIQMALCVCIQRSIHLHFISADEPNQYDARLSVSESDSVLAGHK
jgi:hypothetical protein